MTRRREPFEPRNVGKVGLYLCGPTLNGYCHLGHVRTYLSLDVIVRYLEYKGYKVEYVTNLTDFSDNLVARAEETNEDPLVRSRRFEKAFFEDMEAFHLRPANSYPRASAHIQEIIDMTKGLIQKGLTYESGGVIYFDVKKYRDFGRLSHPRRCDRLFLRLLSVSLCALFSALHSIGPAATKAVGSRSLVSKFPMLLWQVTRLAAFSIAENGRFPPRDPYDIILWKQVNEDELGWESPWGRGRPGWHIECSVMSTKYFGPQLDIHCGGEDLKFPHHESETALSESYTGKKPFVKYWIHAGLVTVEGRKMAKSTGNLITARDFLKKHSAESFRLFVLSKHHRERFDLRENELVKCEEIIKNICKTRDALSDLIRNLGDRRQRVEEERRLVEELSRIKREFLMGMDNDFNTRIALSRFYELIQTGNEILDMRTSKGVIETALNTISELGSILGLFQGQWNLSVSAEARLSPSTPARLEPIPISTYARKWEKGIGSVSE